MSHSRTVESLAAVASTSPAPPAPPPAPPPPPVRWHEVHTVHHFLVQLELARGLALAAQVNVDDGTVTTGCYHQVRVRVWHRE